MTDSSEYITTIKQLMRLTREGEIEWEERPPKHQGGPPSFTGTHKEENLEFRLEEESDVNSSRTNVPPGEGRLEDLLTTRYVLTIIDQSDNSKIVFPPLKAATDLVTVIQSRSGAKKLSEINRRLAAS